ncbi:uncharacterized protein LOC121423350 [Lytechinus variegatus]|uniref:uncharacterized protein LOC121423350 n=1 Tax=Lytechinus variegatus TaxID=7654 RepID=UPI001BB145FC|nr:uncharacterized protein LOC121423350 [Lytechinus variegatus]
MKIMFFPSKLVFKRLFLVSLLYRSMSSSAYRNRRKALPPLPMHIDDLVIRDQWSETTTDERFLLFDNTHPRVGGGTFRIICFCAGADLRLLCDTDELFMDGTFSVAPRHFMQIYTIHGFVNGKQLPLVYALLTGKTTQIYTKLFQTLKQKAAELQLVLNPLRVMSDFEVGLLRAIMAEFPQAEHKGCYFHFCQALHRKIKAIGLQALYNDPQDQDTRIFVRKMMATAFLPPGEVVGAVQELRRQAPAVPRIDEFNDYFQDTWIAGHFPVSMWNVHGVDRRTNNDIEGWHNAFNRLIAKHHPNIWELIMALKKQQSMVSAMRLQIQAGENLAVRQRKYVRLNQRLQILTQRYINAEIPQQQFLLCVSYAIAAPR